MPEPRGVLGLQPSEPIFTFLSRSIYSLLNVSSLGVGGRNYYLGW